MNRDNHRQRRSVFRKAGKMPGFLQLFDDGFFRNGLAVRGAHQSASHTFCGNVEGLMAVCIILPGNRRYQTEQFFKGSADLFRSNNKNPFGKMHFQIAKEKLFNRSKKAHTAVFRLYIRHAEFP